MQWSGEMREIFHELGEKIKDGKMEQPLFHTVVQCLYLKREIVEERMKEAETSPVARIQCEAFLDWLGKHPRFPFKTVQSEDSLQEKVRVLLLEEQLFLFDILEDLPDAIRRGDKKVLMNFLKLAGLVDNEE